MIAAQKKKEYNGFTLIELVIALAVTAIAAAGLAMSAGAFERGALNSASQALKADMRYAQRMAIVEGRRWGVVFDFDGNAYIVYSTKPRTTEKVVELPGGVSLYESSAPDLEYLPRGTSSHGFRVTLRKGRYWQRVTATVSGGRVDVKDIGIIVNGKIPVTGD